MKKKICLLGSTGSIGKSTLEVCRHLQSEVEVYAIAAKQNIEQLQQQIIEFNPRYVVVYDKDKAARLQKIMPDRVVLSGMQGLEEISRLPEIDLVVSALVGSIGIAPVVAAIEAGHTIALANKETLVAAGHFIMNLAKKRGVPILPIDSEHSAIFQCMQGSQPNEISRLILTASGGPFRQYSVSSLEHVTPIQALKHPTWKMGPKVTIDSSTLMNKGLEIIEAHFLFDMPIDKIDVIVHPQSIIHSMVEFQDGNLLAQLSEQSMCLPIQYALTYPKRCKGLTKPFDFKRFSSLNFYPADFEKFKCLSLAYEAIRIGGTMPCFMNGANEVLVERFLQGEIAWKAIGYKLEKLMNSYSPISEYSIEEVYEIDALAKAQARGV